MSFHFFFAKTDNFLLDKLPSIFSASTSRKLSSNASYAMRIRRASDNAELDVGFAGNSIDEQAIKNFGGYNLLGYTEDLTNAVWTVGKTDVSFSAVVSSGITAPDNTNTAFNVKMSLEGATGGGDILDFKQNLTPNLTLGENYSTSIFLRSGDGVSKTLGFFNIAGDIKIITIGTDWQKYEFTNTSDSNASGVLRFRLQGSSTDNLVNLEVWHPQAEIGSSAKQYQPRLAGGASDCFITKWYVQSGNGNDAIQTVVTNQPKIYDVATGEVTKENGKPAIIFDGVDDHLFIANVAGRSNIDAYFVNKHDDNSTTAINNEVYLYPTGDGGSNFGFVGSKNSPNASLHSSGYGSPSLYKNNILLSPANRGEVYSLLGQTQNIINHKGASTSSWNEFQYGLYNSSGGLFHFEGTLQEIIIFDKNLTTKERTLLHSDINNHFNIY